MQIKKIYKKGARKEYHIIYQLRKNGFEIAQRSRGSNSPIDIFAISRSKRIIKFIQSKRTLSKTMNHTDEKLKKSIEKKFDWLNGKWEVQFVVL